MPTLSLKRPGLRQQWILDPFRKLLPPAALVHVGAGAGRGPLAQWREWDIDQVLIVDAQATRLAWVEQAMERRPAWRAVHAVLASSPGIVDWHCASNDDESGLLPASALTGVWPGLGQRQSETREATTLDDLAAEHALPPEDVWLFVDCLPALTVLQGAARLLVGTSVVWVRVVNGGAAPESADLEPVTALLTQSGFVLVDTGDGIHPSLGHALFVKRAAPALRKQLLQLQSAVEQGRQQGAALAEARDEQATLVRELQEQVEQLTRALDDLEADYMREREQLVAGRDREAALAAAAQRDCDTAVAASAALEKDNAALIASRDALQRRVDSLTRACEEHATLAAERQAALDQLAAQRDEQAALASERQAQLTVITSARDEQATLARDIQRQLDTVARANAALEKEKATLVAGQDDLHKQIASLTQARDKQAKLAEDRQAAKEQLAKARDEQAKLAAEREAKLAAATKSRDEQTRLASDRQRQLDVMSSANAALGKEKATLLARQDELHKQVAALTQARDKQAKLAEDRQAAKEQLAKARDEQAKLAAERQVKLAAVTKSRDEQTRLASDRQARISQLETACETRDAELVTLRQALTQAQAAVEAADARVAAIENEMLLRDARQQMLNDEITRAEAQIDLIKDVVLRGAGL